MQEGIKEVLEHYGADFVPEANRYRKMRCPFHDDRTASASVNTGTGKFKCFACDLQGDSLDIVQRKEGLADFASARDFLEGLLGGSVAELRQESPRQSRRSILDGSRPVRGQRSILQNRVRRKPLDRS